MKIKVLIDGNGKWYKKGEIYEVRDSSRYEGIGVQVWNSDNPEPHPDVVMNGDYEYL